MKTALLATVIMGIWLAPIASADPQDQAFLSYLAAHKVAVDPVTAIKAGHIACTQLATGISENLTDEILAKQFPTTINGGEYWIVDAAQKTYCPHH